jgi:hypothetical protein
MPRPDYKRCRICKRHSDEVGPISHTRLCTDCGSDRLARNVIGLSEQRGPEYLHYLRRSLLATHRRLVASEHNAP